MAALPLDDDLVLYAPGGSQAYVLNRTGARVWSLCDGTRAVETIAEEIAAEYGADHEAVLGDVRAFVAHLGRSGLLG